MLNLPITDTFAVRVNAGWTDDAGFINQPNLYVLDASGVPISSRPPLRESGGVIRRSPAK